jgi:hypothetical protein
LVVGPGAGAFREAQAITDVAGGIMAVLRGKSYRERSDQL